ncbi:MAG: DUF3187 family protein [Bdellovibrionales bacterium]|nr:DUF3187 family protein [Bdellovibrionales bacterium]
MRVIRMIALAIAALTACSALAEVGSYHIAHPVGWMYASPVGEMPGWAGKSWFNMEFSQANIWNQEMSVTDRRTGDIYKFKADYEQSTAVITTGFQLTPSLAFSVEVPYANHNGGFLDDFIDQFHVIGNFDRFMRTENGKFDNSFVIQRNGVNQISSPYAEGVGNIRTKLKLWLLQWNSPTPGACQCGFAVSAQAKFPTQNRREGLTSGRNDYTGTAHLGVPFSGASGAWFTAAVSKNSYNETFSGWPQRQWQQMYELVLRFALDSNFALLITARTESPLFEQKYLKYNYTYTDPVAQDAEREASGWLGLTEWRGSQSAAFVYRWGQGSSVGFSIMEDWGLGDRDSGSWNYINGSPDVAFITQMHFVF